VIPMMFFFQAEDGIRDGHVTGVQTCALPIFSGMLHRRTVVLILVAATIAAGGRGLGVITTYVPAYLKDSLHLGELTTGVLFNIRSEERRVGKECRCRCFRQDGTRRAEEWHHE